MAVFRIVYRDQSYAGRVVRVEAYNFTFTQNQEWVEFWDEGALHAKLTVKALEVLSIQTLADEPGSEAAVPVD
jgi:hypothetical protein